MDILQHSQFYLVGIKGVAMTALAQCLIDAGKVVRGCDVAEAFVTQSALTQLRVEVDIGFDAPPPADTDCVIYTAAHQGWQNPVVTRAREAGIVVVSYAEAVAGLCNQKQGVAVCGVGGKSTVTAMIVWILEQLAETGLAARPSYVLGVGSVSGLPRTGRWQADTKNFIIEADEYVADPTAKQRGEQLIPKILYLKPATVVCTNLKFDHPDVFTDFEHTRRTFYQFFTQLQPNGTIIINGDDQELVALATRVTAERPDVQLVTFSEGSGDITFNHYASVQGKTTARLQLGSQELNLVLSIPGQFNVKNALAAIAAVRAIGVKPSDAVHALASFPSTKRRFEYLGTKRGVWYYDDYAHHPHEVAATIQALSEWFPSHRKIVIFQPHTFSRTKQLFTEFVTAFATAQEVLFTDIFASARESADPTITSDLLAEAVSLANPHAIVKNLHTNQAVADYLRSTTQSGDVVLTMGAGDVYHIHELII